MVSWYYWSKSDRGNGSIPLVDQPSAFSDPLYWFCLCTDCTEYSVQMAQSCTGNGDGDGDGVLYDGASTTQDRVQLLKSTL
jgi:hypothetical protein